MICSISCKTVSKSLLIKGCVSVIVTDGHHHHQVTVHLQCKAEPFCLWVRKPGHDIHSYASLLLAAIFLIMKCHMPEGETLLVLHIKTSLIFFNPGEQTSVIPLVLRKTNLCSDCLSLASFLVNLVY